MKHLSSTLRANLPVQRIATYCIGRSRVHTSTRLVRRSYSNQAKQVSPHVSFYKDFGRPIAKVFFGAMFTYQVLYWIWVKLETDEIRAEKNAEIAALENKLRDVSAQRKSGA